MSLRRLIAAGATAARASARTVLAVFFLELAWSGVFAVAVGFTLSDIYAARPLFRRGVDGDLLALALALQPHEAMVRALAWTGLAMLLGWKLLGLYLGAGLAGALAGQRFTQTASDRFPAFFRLSVWSLIFYAMAVLVGLMGLKLADLRLEDVKAWSTLVGVPLAGLAPGLLLLLITALAVDCGRAHLIVNGGPAARAFGAGLKHAITRPAVLALYLLYGLAWLALSALLLPLGFVGPVLLLFLRQLVALARFWARAIATGGQIASIKGSP